RLWVSRGVAPDDVCDRVDLGDQPRLAHPVADFRGDRTVRGRKIGAGQSVGALRPLREALGELHDSLAERARLAAANPTHRFRYHTHAYFAGTALATFNTRLSSCRGLTERRIGRG